MKPNQTKKIKSSQTKQNQIKANQIKSNQIQSNHTKPGLGVTRLWSFYTKISLPASLVAEIYKAAEQLTNGLGNGRGMFTKGFNRFKELSGLSGRIRISDPFGSHDHDPDLALSISCSQDTHLALSVGNFSGTTFFKLY